MKTKGELSAEEFFDFDITRFHSCEDSLYWHGCYSQDARFNQYITPESFAHPAKMSWGLADRIFKHLKQLGLLQRNDVICDFMSGSGRTNIMATLHGHDSIGVELEKHFIDMQEANKSLLERKIGRKVNWQVIQGDSRKLSDILQQNNMIGITSPPFESMISSEKPNISLDKKRKLMTAWKRNKDFGNHSQLEIQNKYSSNPLNIGNLKDSVLKRNPHSPSQTATKYGSLEQQIANLPDKNLVGITSPPYDTNSQHKLERTAEIRDVERGYHGQYGFRNQYSTNKENLGNQQGESYLQAMLQVYHEAAKILPVIVTVTKNPTRNGKLRRLDLDTISLLQAAGYQIIDYHRAVLFKERKQTTLKGGIKKQLDGRISFFKRLSVQKGNITSSWEDMLIAVRKRLI